MKKCTIIRLSLKLLPPKYQTNKGLIKCWSFAKTCTTKLLAWQRKNFVIWEKLILTTLQVPTPQYGQTHSNNSSPTADELFECVWTFSTPWKHDRTTLFWCFFEWIDRKQWSKWLKDCLQISPRILSEFELII